MFVCVHICKFTYMCICTDIYVRTYRHITIYMHAFLLNSTVHNKSFSYLLFLTLNNLYIYICMGIYVHVYIYICMCVCYFMYMHMKM